MSNAAAVAATVRALRDLGRVEPVDEAVVTAAVALAEAVDANPENASLWREYQAALRALREVGADGGDGGDIGAILEALRGAASVGDAKNEPANARRRGR